MTIAFDPAKHCGAHGRQAGAPCRQVKGTKTNHPGAGRCWLHGGNTPNGQAAAAKEAAQHAVAKLGIPAGSGDPMVLLTKAVQHAEGFLEATGQVLTDAAGEETPNRALIDAAAEQYAGAIRAAARTGKAAVDADVADRLAALDERASELLMRFVAELLERAVPVAKRPAIQAWARGRLAELAADYDRPGTAVAVH